MNSEGGHRKRVTLFINSLHGGGAERVCVTLANGLKDRGWDVELVVLNLKGAVFQSELDKDIAITDLHASHARTVVFKLARHLKTSRCEKMLVFNHQLAILLVILRRVLNLKFKIVVRNINTLSQKKANQKNFWHKYVVDGLVRIFYSGVDKIIAQSQGMKNDLVKNYAIDEAKITVIHNPLGQKFEQFAKTAGANITEKQDYLLCVGKLEAQKALNEAIEAFAIFAKQNPETRLKIVGQGSLKNKLQRQAQMLQIAERVDFEGFHTDLIPFYTRAKATVLTSLYEGFPNVLIESIATGTAVIAFDCPSGPREIIEENINGFLILNRDVNAMAKAMLKAVQPGTFQSDKVRQTANKYRLARILGEYEKLLV